MRIDGLALAAATFSSWLALAGCGLRTPVFGLAVEPPPPGDDAGSDSDPRIDSAMAPSPDRPSPDRAADSGSDGPIDRVGLDVIAAPPPPPPPPPAPRDIEITLDSGSQDSMQDPGGSIGDRLLHWPWVSLYSDQHWGALRFRVPDIAAGSEIVEASIRVFVDSEEEGNPNTTIHVEPTANPAPLSSRGNDISDRPRSVEGVVWRADRIGAGWQQSPSVKGLVQLLVDQRSRLPGSYIVFIFDAHDPIVRTAFEFRQFDHSGGAFGARLAIRYRAR